MLVEIHLEKKMFYIALLTKHLLSHSLKLEDMVTVLLVSPGRLLGLLFAIQIDRNVNLKQSCQPIMTSSNSYGCFVYRMTN